jgi:hypothetical protein
MSEPNCLIIDDVDAALATMSDLGRSVVKAGADAVRNAVRAFAARRGWMIVSHSAYVTWALDAMNKDLRPWITLDPLFPIGRDGLTRLRLSREFDTSSSILTKGFVHVTDRPFAGQSRSAFGVVDDAAASGRTLRFVSRLLSDEKSTLARVLVCASTREAREGLRASTPGLQWAEYIHGDWRICHLRDGCPHLPFSGRPTGTIPGDLNSRPIEARVIPTQVAGNLWQVLALDAGVRSAIKDARAQVVQNLSHIAGEPARVRHLHQLGEAVPALVNPNHATTQDTVLESLLE